MRKKLLKLNHRFSLAYVSIFKKKIIFKQQVKYKLMIFYS